MKKVFFAVLAAAMLAGCGTPAGNAGNSETKDPTVSGMERPSLIRSTFTEKEVTGRTESYTVASDFSNVHNRDDYAYYSEAFRRKIAEDLFVIQPGGMDEFYQIYESNTYSHEPSFVTVDSMLHTFHLYYAYLQKTLEKTELRSRIRTMTASFLEESGKQLEALKGTEWEAAAQRNVDYFSVASALIGDEAELSETAKQEYDRIMAAQGIDVTPLFAADPSDPQMMDYSQFKPRGYYTESSDLESYFRTMMWYGQMNFTQKYEELDRSALLAVLAMKNGRFEDWEAVYTITAFFSGESDDNGWYEYMPLIQAVYGEDEDAEALKADPGKWEAYHEMTGKLGAPKLNSMPVYDETIEPDLDAEITGFRLMGQRFTIDADILQNLIYRKVKENTEGKQRTLPSGLDVPAALGSDTALAILQETGVSGYENYDRNMNALRSTYQNSTGSLWTASVYSSWLNTLRPLTAARGEGWPAFMQSAKWQKKNLLTFLGSYTELKHDSILYAKQVMAEMGAEGMMEEIPDDRGYVECEPEVFSRMKQLAEFTAEGLKRYGALNSQDEENLGLFAELAGRLETIAEKELRGELPDDDEFELIRSYGGTLEHLWLYTMNEGIRRASDCPAPVVADIATDPNGSCLEIATGNPAVIHVAVYFDGAVRICTGSVYSYYEFAQPISDRMTDEAWRDRLNNWQDPPAGPAWSDELFDKGWD